MSRNFTVQCRPATFVMLFAWILICSGAEVLAQNTQLQLRGPTDGLSTAPTTPPSVSSTANSRDFHGSGMLYRVKSGDTGAERYALMDGDGKILAFLAPSSRHDLQSFIGREIGIDARTFGRNDDVAPYVMVNRVSLISAPVADAAVQPATHQQALEPVMVPVESTQQSWGVPAQTIPAGGYVADPAAGGYVADPAGGYVVATGGGNIGCVDGSCGGAIYDSGGCGDPGCTSCTLGGYTTSTSCTTCGIGMPCCCPKPCGPPGWLWLRGEYLLWFTDGMNLPPLVTTSPGGTPAGQAGVLGESGTEVVYGNEDILTEGRSGFRIMFGGFFGPCKKWGWEAEYFDVGDIDETFSARGDGNGNPILARPFFNLNLGQNDSELISFPGLLTGTVDVHSYSRFNGAAGRFRFNKCCKQTCYEPCGSCGPYGGCNRCGYPPYGMIDFTLGYRYYGLDEGLSVAEDLTSLQPDTPGRFEVLDTFQTRNDFNGGEIGTSYLAGWNRWTLEGLMRIAIGGTRQHVRIDGATTISPLVAPAETFEGGLLAQRSNIGEYERDRFSMIPELGTNLGFYISPRMRVTFGYTLVYWSNVARPGEQIDLDVNTDLIPPEVTPFNGALRPEFVFRETDFWAHGLNVGLDYRW